MDEVMFVCLHNADLSQVAAAFFNRHKTRKDMKGTSSGICPARKIPAIVLETMSEVDIDLSGITPKEFPFGRNTIAGTIVMMSYSGELGLCVFDIKMYRWDFTHPESNKSSVKELRVVRDEIEKRVKELIAENNY
ncbi:hypothetical protein BGX29_008675 [Mortierella sp. GBA35]|nr:hypothetical protein BGX29_008675 [Mortierella sp. GBA35]